jgi:hypothetical protein
MASFHVSFRLSHDAWKRYSALAEVSELPLGTFLRRRLELQDQALATELDLRARGAKPPDAENGKSQPPPVVTGTLIEILLLLRSIAGPQRSVVAQKEVERQGLESWKAIRQPS